MKSLFLLLVIALLTTVAPQRLAAAVQPQDSLRLRSKALPDTARLRLLSELSRYYGPRDPALCISYALRGLPLARRLRASEIELGLLDNVAISHARSGAAAEAMRYCLEELKRAQQLGNRRYEIDAMLALSNLQSTEENHAESEATLRRALKLAQQYGTPLALARAQAQMGNFLLTRKRYPEAIRFSKAALPTFTKLGRIYEQGDCLSSLAEAANAQHQYAAGLTYGRQAASLMAQKGDTYGQSWVAGVLCASAAGMGNLPLARQYGQQALALARLANIPGTEVDVTKDLIETYVRQGDYPDAFELQKRLTHLRDSLFDQTRASEMARLQTQYETERKQREIRELRHRARIQALERDRDRTRLRWLGVGVGALLLGLILFAWLFRRLQLSRAALDRSNRTKDQLLSIVGHDLRGPVAAFQQVGGMLRHYARHPDPVELEDLAGELEHGATQLAGLLDNLLHWARGQMGQVVNRPTALSVETVVMSVLNLYRPAAANKHLTLRAELPAAEAVPVWADAALLDTVLRNLVANAIKFTPVGGEVVVSSRPAADGAQVEFSVRDTGVGMTAGAAAALFEPAVQPTQGTAGEQGTGLGVAVCRQFVALLGGELRVETAPGAGTRFWFALPAASQLAVASVG